MTRRLLAAALFLASILPGIASAQMVPSTCHMIAEAVPEARFASFETDGPPLRLTQLQSDEVRITYAAHATYLIESPAGVTIATDYSGYAGPGVVPDIVTMNKAHSTHNTPFPDPAIEHVLRGWNPEGGPAEHQLTVEDVYIRNVSTDIRGYGGMEPDGNSIFIFEIAGLCIGHLGHLHHLLTDEHYAEIGRLDVLMVPVDGGLTMSQVGMGEIAARLRSSIILPMHRFASPIESFLDELGEGFAVDHRDERSLVVSTRALPTTPTVIVLDGV